MNRTTTSWHKNLTPFEAMARQIRGDNAKRPLVEHLRVLGCKAYMHIQEERRTKSEKLAERAEEGILVGYEGDNIYKVYVPSRRGNKVIRSSTVTFNENKQYTQEVKDKPSGLYELDEAEATGDFDLEHGGAENETVDQNRLAEAHGIEPNQSPEDPIDDAEPLVEEQNVLR